MKNFFVPTASNKKILQFQQVPQNKIRTTREIIRKISHVQDISDQCPTSKQAFFLSKSSIHFRVHNFTTYNREKEGMNICGVDEYYNKMHK